MKEKSIEVYNYSIYSLYTLSMCLEMQKYAVKGKHPNPEPAATDSPAVIYKLLDYSFINIPC